MGKAASFYSWITAALGPVAMLHLRGRKLRGLEFAKHGPERCGYASFDRPNGPLLWFHAVSVGEGMEALPVIKRCLSTRPHVNILMTSSTVTAFSILRKTLPPGVMCQVSGPTYIRSNGNLYSRLCRSFTITSLDDIKCGDPGTFMNMILEFVEGLSSFLLAALIHISNSSELSFAPVDTPFAVERFLSFWEPQAAVFMESELWPNLILESSKRGVRLALLNARMSPKSLWRWSLSPAKGLAMEIVSKFSLIMPVNNKEALRYQELGALPHQIQFGGNLKYASGAMDFASTNGPMYHEMRRHLLGRRVWLAASTHPGEEEVVASIHKRLKGMFPNLLTIIAPRHPHRGHSIKSAIMYNHSWDAPRRSQNEPITTSTDIYIADTLGELAMFYHLVSLVFVGGSLFEDLQGHNIAEPASAGCAVVTGRHVGHFQEMVTEMKRHSPLSIEQVAGERDLFEFLRRLFDNGHSLNLRREAALSAAHAAVVTVMHRVYKWLNIIILKPAFGSCSLQREGH